MSYTQVLLRRARCGGCILAMFFKEMAMAANQRITTNQRRMRLKKAGRKRKKLMSKRSTLSQEELFGTPTEKK
jgi:hypothetical protein